MWIRYKHRYAYGEDRKWTYLEIDDDWKSYGYDEEEWTKNEWRKDEPYNEDQSLAEYIDIEHGISDHYSHSDKYRGFRFERVDGLPPNDELLRRLESAETKAKYWMGVANRFKKMVNETGLLTKKDTDIT